MRGGARFPTGGRRRARVQRDAVSQPLNLTSDIIAGIYLGKVTQWNDKARPSAGALPPSPISPCTARTAAAG
jgi:ABC-type phosphate transport system substrate-binding protein